MESLVATVMNDKVQVDNTVAPHRVDQSDCGHIGTLSIIITLPREAIAGGSLFDGCADRVNDKVQVGDGVEEAIVGSVQIVARRSKQTTMPMDFIPLTDGNGIKQVDGTLKVTNTFRLGDSSSRMPNLVDGVILGRKNHLIVFVADPVGTIPVSRLLLRPINRNRHPAVSHIVAQQWGIDKMLHVLHISLCCYGFAADVGQELWREQLHEGVGATIGKSAFG